MGNPEKLATFGTQDEGKQHKNTTHVLNTTMRKQAQITQIGHDSAPHPLKTTVGKDEPNIVRIGKSERLSQHGTQNAKTHNRTTQNTKKMSNTDPPKNLGVNSGAREG